MKNELLNLQEAQDLAKLQSQMQLPAKNINLDGSFELGWGTMLLCFGLVQYLNPILPKIVWAHAWSSWIGFAPLICGAFAVYGVPRMIKRYITWPRTGYVAQPNEVKLKQLVMLMILGAALGFGLVLPFILYFEIHNAITHDGAQSNLQTIILHAVKLLVCAAVVVFLGPKVITKRTPALPTAYDAEQIKREFSRTAEGRKVLRGVKLSLVALFIGLPMLVTGVVLGLFWLGKSWTSHVEIHWPQLGLLGFTVAMNALLYLMINAVAFKQHRWKWLVVAMMALGPIGVLATVPFPAVKPELMPVMETFPPQVMLFLGLAWSLSSLATLISFVRHHPLSSPDAA